MKYYTLLSLLVFCLGTTISCSKDSSEENEEQETPSLRFTQQHLISVNSGIQDTITVFS